MNGAEDDRRRLHWVVPAAEGAQYVPDAAAVAAIVDGLARAGWLRWEARPPYDPDGPFFYSTFPGSSGRAEHIGPGRVIRQSHCQTIGVMVTDRVLVAPTARAHATNAPCSACGAHVLEEAVPAMSRVVPAECPACQAAVALESLATLPLFRFAVWIEPWHPRVGGEVRSVDPELLRLLQEHTGFAFRDEGE